jgi:hypothetical protein
MLWHTAAACVVAAAAGAWGGFALRAVIADRAEAEAREVIATERETAIHTALVETKRRLDAQQEAARHATTQATQARAAAAAASDLAGRLRDEAAAAADRACADPAVAGGGTAKALADVLGEATDRLREVAAAADAAIIAGRLCEAAFDDLTE